VIERSDISREYPPFPLVGVGALIIDDERIVLIKRGREPAKGEWSIPGGLVKVGETLKDAVSRETLEETGLQVQSETLVELVERIFRDDQGRERYHYIIADYRCRVVGGNLTAGSDASEALWVHQAELHHYDLAPITIEVIRKAFGRA